MSAYDDDDDIPELVESAPAVVEPVRDTKSVPLTLICGFLGAGKSTLLKYILTERHGYRIAVIMNEFSDTADIEAKSVGLVGVDGAPGEMAEEYLELANGCLCCSIKDPGIASIEKLMRKKGSFDYILLETTGLADPGSLAPVFWRNSEMSDIYLDGVVCVVDGVFGLQQLRGDGGESAEEQGLSCRQVACADVILVNKVDLAAPADVAALEAAVGALNPAASVHRTTRGAVDLGRVLNLNAYASRPDVHEHEQHAEDGGGGGHHDHLDGIASVVLPVPVLDGAQMAGLERWLQGMLWDGRLPDGAAVEVLRCKGVWATTDGRVHVLQGVRSLYEIVADDGRAGGPAETGKLVLIGRGVERVRSLGAN